MEKKQGERFQSLKANKILYLSVIGVLCLSAIIIGITAALSRPNTTEVPTGDGILTAPTTERPTEAPTDSLESSAKTLEAPLSGSVCKVHDLSTPVYSITMADWRVHTGIDVMAALGTDVTAAADGTIKEVYKDPLMGTCVSISHGGDLTTVYKNLGETLPAGVVAGATIKKGETVGVIGETALIEIAEEPHLHFEVHVGANAVDPLEYISEESQSAAFVFDEDTDYEL